MSRPVALDLIQFDAGTQIRAAINEAVVGEYAELMQADTKFPPVVLFHDGNAYYMADGFHRAMAGSARATRRRSASRRPSWTSTTVASGRVRRIACRPGGRRRSRP